MCSVCQHPKRAEVEHAIERGEPIKRIATLYQLPVTTVRRHRDADHRNKAPIAEAKIIAIPADMAPPLRPEPEPRNPWPTNAEIVKIDTPAGRRELLLRYFAERRWKGGKTIALLAYLWRRHLGDRAEEQVAEIAANAALRLQRLRGPRHMRREEMIAKAMSIAEKAEAAGKWADAISALKFVAEMDGLTYEPGVLSALVEAQAWRLIRPLIEREAPQLIEKIDRTLTGAERRRQRAIQAAERAPTDEDDDADMTPALPPAEARTIEHEEREEDLDEPVGGNSDSEIAIFVEESHPVLGKPTEPENDMKNGSPEIAVHPAEEPANVASNEPEVFAMSRKSGGRRARTTEPKISEETNDA